MAKAIGAAYLVLPVIGAWALIRELLFGARTEQMAKILEAEGGLPVDDLPRTPAGRIIRAPLTRSLRSTRPRPKPHPRTGAPGSGSAVPTTPPGTASVPVPRCATPCGCSARRAGLTVRGPMRAAAAD